MIKITSETSQKELIQILSQEIVGISELFIQIVSLPYFLSSVPSARVFRYKVNNYPREIKWFSQDAMILTFLRRADFVIGFPQTLIGQSEIKSFAQPTVIFGSQSPNTQNEKLASVVSNTDTSNSQFSETNTNTQNKYKHKLEEFKDSLRISSTQSIGSSETQEQVESVQSNFLYSSEKQKAEQIQTEFVKKDFAHSVVSLVQESQPSSVVNSTIPPIEPVAQNKVTLPKVNQNKEYINANLALLESLKQKVFLEREKTYEANFSESQDLHSEQNFDNWVNKINITKQAVIKNQKTVAIKVGEMTYNISEVAVDLYNNFVRRIVLNGIVASVVVLFIVSGVLMYPRNNYQIEVPGNQTQDSFEARLQLDKLKKSTLQFTVESEKVPSGVQQVATENNLSVGKVKLINNSAGEVVFDRGGLLLISESNGLEYRQKTEAIDPKIFRVQGKNSNANSVEITINSSASGSQYNLSEGSAFRVYNLKGEALGISFKAMATTEIKDTFKTDKNVVSDKDQADLKADIETKIQSQKQVFFNQLKTDGSFSSDGWSKVNQLDYNYSNKPNEQSDKLKLTTVASFEFLSISKSQLQEILQANNAGVDAIQNLVDVALAKESDPKLGDVYVATVMLSYKPDKKQATVAMNNTTQDPSITIKETFPTMTTLSVEKKGVQLFGLKPLNSLTLVQK